MRITTTVHHPNWPAPKSVSGEVLVTGQGDVQVVVTHVDGFHIGQWPDRLAVSLGTDALWDEYLNREVA